jgi:hypothetical protein
MKLHRVLCLLGNARHPHHFLLCFAVLLLDVLCRQHYIPPWQAKAAMAAAAADLRRLIAAAAAAVTCKQLHFDPPHLAPCLLMPDEAV